MTKTLLSNLNEFEKWKQEQIEEYKNCFSPAVRTTKEIVPPKQFPAIVVYENFDDADAGMFFFYEFVYCFDFELNNK